MDGEKSFRKLANGCHHFKTFLVAIDAEGKFKYSACP
jgi:hypothetical protein